MKTMTATSRGKKRGNMDLLDVCCSCREVWEEVLGSIRHAIMVIQPTGKIIFSSPIVEVFLGFSPKELQGESFDRVFTPEDRDLLYPNLLAMVQRNDRFEDELMLMRKDGTRFMAFMVLRPCFDPRREQNMAIVSIQDIDRQKRMEKSFRTSHYEDLVKIANGIAHELRNPLVGIGGFVNRLFKKCENVESHDEYYAHIMANLKRIENLVHKVEMFASLPRPSLTDESAAAIISEAVELSRSRMEGRRIHCELAVDEQALYMDRFLVIRAISILIENAIDAAAEGGVVRIRGNTGPNRYSVVVADNGSGIPPQDLPHIFAPFFSTKPDGVGIDLALVKRIVEAHGGQVAVESTPREGSVFTLHFPIERRRSIRSSRILVWEGAEPPG